MNFYMSNKRFLSNYVKKMQIYAKNVDNFRDLCSFTLCRMMRQILFRAVINTDKLRFSLLYAQIEDNMTQLYFVCDLKMSAMMKENTTAAETPALAAASGPVSAAKSPSCAPRMAPFASK